MTVPRPAGFRRRRLGRLTVAVAVAALAALALGAAMQGTFVYARTPAQVRVSRSAGEHLRVEGRVVPATVTRDGGRTRFELEGGGKRLEVVAEQAPPGAFREGQGAVVEGRLGPDGSFVADNVIAQHGNSYRAASPAPAERRPR